MSEEEIEYAKMMEIPINTCEIRYKKQNKNLLSSIFKDRRSKEKKPIKEKIQVKKLEGEEEKSIKKVSLTFSNMFTGAIAIILLSALIFGLNITYKNSGINDVLSNAFLHQELTVPKVDESLAKKTYKDFAPVIKNSDFQLDSGTLTLTTGGVLMPCDGIISKIFDLDGKKTIEIKHSDIFKTVISGAEVAFFKEGDIIYKSMPVCYSATAPISMCFYNGDELLKSFEVENSVIVWKDLK